MFRKLFRRFRFSTDKQVDYYKLTDQIMNAQVENEELKLAIQKIIFDMKSVTERAYQFPLVEQVLSSVKSHYLCAAAVEQFVGSMYTPKNEQITQLFLSHAKKNADNWLERQNTEYHLAYLKKLDASQKGDQAKFDDAQHQLLELANQGNKPAQHLVAKEMYKVAMNMMQSKQRKDREKLLKEAYKLFYDCAENEFPHSYYYIGEMAERGDTPGGIDLKFALECYFIAAAYENPQAFFKLAKFHREGIVCEKDQTLEFHYTKKAAEMGLLDAQHNLGVIYREGRITKKDDFKALAWFTHAGNLGFPLSQFNAGMMYWEGADKIKSNKKAALVWFEKIQKSGMIDVSQQIRQLAKEIEKEIEEEQ
ncbi:unnamed protein product [Paramecium octaurelia]|uniref:Sel1 repeat family protein n=1 Tax=Paramecium octaurelia TaxID=43137 RepID=A0A8S1Y9B7_PAROT|nr:unnamed protein product [Paramecium octaurelia]